MRRPRGVRQRARSSRSPRKRPAAVLLVAGAVLVLSLVTFWFWRGAGEPSFANTGIDYNPADEVVVDHTFVLKNDGEAPLTIGRMDTTCDCTTAELSAQVIPSGKLALLRLVFDAGYHDTRGQYVRRGVGIETNDPTRRQVTVRADATVRTHFPSSRARHEKGLATIPISVTLLQPYPQSVPLLFRREHGRGNEMGG